MPSPGSRAIVGFCVSIGLAIRPLITQLRALVDRL
jgi:hypothetical protein